MGCSFLAAIEEREERFGLERRAKMSPQGIETMLLRLERLREIRPENIDAARLRLMGDAMVNPREFDELRRKLDEVLLTPGDSDIIQSRLQALK